MVTEALYKLKSKNYKTTTKNNKISKPQEMARVFPKLIDFNIIKLFEKGFKNIAPIEKVTLNYYAYLSIWLKKLL